MSIQWEYILKKIHKSYNFLYRRNFLKMSWSFWFSGDIIDWFLKEGLPSSLMPYSMENALISTIYIKRWVTETVFFENDYVFFFLHIFLSQIVGLFRWLPGEDFMLAMASTGRDKSFQRCAITPQPIEWLYVLCLGYISTLSS